MSVTHALLIVVVSPREEKNRGPARRPDHLVCRTPEAMSFSILARMAGSSSACCAAVGSEPSWLRMLRTAGSWRMAWISGSAMARRARSCWSPAGPPWLMACIVFWRPALHAALSGSIARPALYVSRALWYSFMRTSMSPFLAIALTYLGSRSRAFSHARLAPWKSPILESAAARLLLYAGFDGSRLIASSYSLIASGKRPSRKCVFPRSLASLALSGSTYAAALALRMSNSKFLIVLSTSFEKSSTCADR
mmetsp:Transcript_7207/g.29939  ORF Transcript_7207/g.29939 Transcript_7207/m.29939 type:complete len:251 (-) Transcript_7207:459-1211(-)